MLVAAMGLLMSSCGIHQDATSNYNQLQTQVVLNQANFEVVGTAKGECTQVYIFGIGGMSSKSLAKNSYAEMVKAANLTGSQAIINVTTEESNLFALVYLKRSITTHGTVIEFIE